MPPAGGGVQKRRLDGHGGQAPMPPPPVLPSPVPPPQQPMANPADPSQPLNPQNTESYLGDGQPSQGQPGAHPEMADLLKLLMSQTGQR